VAEAPPGCGNVVQGIVAGTDGGLWVAAGGKLWRLSDAGWSGGTQPLAIGELPVSTTLATADGRLYLGTYDKGMLELLPGEPRPERLFGRGTGLPSDWVLAACEDHEGGVWLGSGSSGLLRLQNRKVTMLAPPDSWQGRSVLTMCMTHEGGFLVGTEGAGLYRMSRDGAWSVFAAESGLRNNFIWAVHESPDGSMLAGTWTGLDVATGTRFAPVLGTSDFGESVWALVHARDGGLWIGSRAGLAQYRDGAIRWVEPGPNRKLRDIRSILETPDGTLWISTNGNGIGRIRDGAGAPVSPARRARQRFYPRAAARRKRDALDRHARGRPESLQGRAVHRSAHGERARERRHLADRGRWAGLSLDELARRHPAGEQSRAQRLCRRDAEAGEMPRLRLADGLSSLACSNSQPAPGYRTADGRLVFSTDAGLALIDPRAVKLNPQAPPVEIESIRNDDRWERLAPFFGVIDLGPGAKRIEIQYTGLSYALPEKVRFKCRLDGFDPDWVDMGTERRVSYSYLPPGRYVFHVVASNNDGVWNTTGRSLALVVPPYFWQTIWFRLLLGTLGTGAVATLVWFQARRRLLRRVELLERERAIDAERTRIANDMHDDIGAGLTRINMLASTCGPLHDRAG
jgi:uncharacterized protein YceK